MNPFSSTRTTRREFIRRSALSAAGVAVGASLAGVARAVAGRKIPISVQLYSLREECKTNLPGMLAAVSKIGYRAVEFAGYHGYQAGELRKMLDDHGLLASGTHTGYDTVQGDRLKETVEFNRIIGNKFLIVPSLDGKTKQDWLDLARLFNEISVKLQPDGMSVGYHSHKRDFGRFDGMYMWDIFMDHTRHEVIAQLDVANTCDGGADPVAELHKRPGRVRTIHMKAWGGGPEAVIGEDKVDWQGVFSFCETVGGTDWYVVEHETSRNPLDAVRRSFEALRNLGKV